MGPKELRALAEDNDRDSRMIDEGCPAIGGELRALALKWEAERQAADALAEASNTRNQTDAVAKARAAYWQVRDGE
jgi:predicted component of type VI protein secretion system